ncbi:hypothetical protein N7508_003623 [Penicillium antarcticum]|uniref:uncharacterized protein n=1 Tax=Penicillium antarcticum TaxID=416450 RepID=UPI0023900D59|nr:uncharacterized protein N7508_003623 [Penicillium antarcticum]KAJ5312793.1 hypothetical protein N7508_003623 [Penicillium antarcticum]
MMEYTGTAVASLLGFFALRTIYNLYFHPLSKFPGPKIAAATFLYEFYYDVIKSGMYLWEIERMHKEYGPIVRINPREIHIKDSYYYDEIHAGSARKRAKDPKYAVAFGAPYSLVGTIGHDHHRFRRNILNNYFSKRSVQSLTPLIHEKVDKLISNFENAYKAGTVLRLHLDFAALTADVITQYSYGWSHGYLDDSAGCRSNDLADAVNGLMVMWHINRFFPFLITAFRAAPPALLRWLQPCMADLFDLKNRLRRQAAETVQKQQDKKEKEKNGIEGQDKGRSTVFDALTSLDVPAHERVLDRLEDESALLLGAGTETTARAIAVSMFYLSRDKDILAKLRVELKSVLATPLSRASWTDLEGLPYLTGVVNEGLRLSHGMTARLARVSPTEPMLYKDWAIPAGTPVSQSNYFVHMDSALFPEPEKFDPERWVRAAEKGEYLSRFIVSFTKGSRQCLGINLAYAEIYLALAHIARRIDFELYETTVDNITVYRELGIGCPKTGLLGVRAIVTGILEK